MAMSRLPIAVAASLLTFALGVSTARANDPAPSPDGQAAPVDQGGAAEPARDIDVSGGDAAMAIAENAQDTFLLRRLLRGRQFKFVGRLEGDAAGYNIESFVNQDGGEIRRFRVGLAGLNPWFENVSYKLEVDLSDGDSTISDAYLNFDFGDRGSLTVGNQDGSQSLSASTGSLSQLFMESPLPISALSLDKRIGIAYDRYRSNWGIHALLFGRDLNDQDAEHRGAALRGWFNPHRSNNGLWHVGGNLVREYVNSSNRLDTRPESHVTDIKLVDTGTYDDLVHQTRYGFEAAGASGSYTGRFELMMTEWDRTGGIRNRFYGAYLENGFYFTGQPFRYTDGKFVRPRLAPGETAVEMAFRLSWLDLNDGDVQGGEEFNVGAAVNYYTRRNLRYQLNVIQVNSDQPDSDGWLMQARIQYNW